MSANHGTSASSRSADPFGQEMVAQIPYMRAFARSLCRAKSEADDLTQETLVRAWKARRSYEPGTNLRAWLLKIMRNCFYTDLRRTKRQAPWSDAAAERILVSQGAQTASVDLADLQRALAGLPDEQREALILVGAGGFSYDEAALICDCAIGTIKSRVSRARSAVVAAMEGGAPAALRTARGADAMRAICRSLDMLMADAGRRGFVPMEHRA